MMNAVYRRGAGKAQRFFGGGAVKSAVVARAEAEGRAVLQRGAEEEGECKETVSKLLKNGADVNCLNIILWPVLMGRATFF
jgi:hypothetical protein